jgi:hypothetical protein
LTRRRASVVIRATSPPAADASPRNASLTVALGLATRARTILAICGASSGAPTTTLLDVVDPTRSLSCRTAHRAPVDQSRIASTTSVI